MSRRSALCTEQGATALRRAISSLPYFPYTDLTAPSGNAAVAYAEARRDLVAAQGVPFSQHSFAPINKRSFEKLICQVHVSQLPQNRLLETQVYSIPPQLSSSECTMWADPNYLRSWRDFRRRELLFWFFVLSYVPGILLIIVVVNVFEHDAPEHIGIYFSAAWLAGFAGASLYRQNFRCPRCHQFFFRRYMLVDPYSRNCVHCNLACGAGRP